ncbi:MAG: cytidine deaminase [candidate division WOR-3 bacterium]|jgi:cytidine deaminase
MAKTSSRTLQHKKIAKELVRRVKTILKNAHAPYSKVPVGAALYCTNGHVYTGCNVENASYSLTMCAERVALFKAISEGENNFLLLLLYSPRLDGILPCGACLQVFSEFAPNIIVATMNKKKEFHFYPLQTILTKPFHLPE